MKKWILMCMSICILTGCSMDKGNITQNTVEESTQERTVLIQQKSQEIIKNETSEGEFLPAINFPANEAWILDKKIIKNEESILEIQYVDGIIDADCTFLAIKNGIPDLPENTYEDSLEEKWEGQTMAGEVVPIKVQHAIDEKTILVTWEYDTYTFAILGDVKESGKDTNSIPKTAIHIISYFK
ncbi:MAG: hypothetical protein J6A92_03465 [Lachnospiraceae bacterium]|nr:hypothetical protein [Lachnospiraceae bacterium]